MIIGVESSCDESAIACFDPEQGIVGEWVHSQILQHQPYGGIVPDLASREHLEHFPHMAQSLFGVWQPQPHDRIAVTTGPGLAGCLALGMAFSNSMATAYDLPVCGVNHLRGHAFSPFISLHGGDPVHFAERFAACLPHLGLIVSGGNTVLFAIEPDHSLVVLAGTVDDAAGEALDKGAKLLGMPYPGGPLIEKTAAGGNPAAYDFPRAFASSREPRFSFSGLKTSLRYQLEKMSDAECAAALPDLCASYQEAVVAALLHKTRQFLSGRKWASIGLSGGVANNARLREGITALAQRRKVPLFIAERRHSGDNAAMIAFAAFIDPQGTVPSPESFLPNWALDTLPPAVNVIS